MKIALRHSAVACVIGGLSVAGCQMGPGPGLTTSDAELARQILAQSCEIGEWHTGGSAANTSNVLYVRHGKINKRSDLTFFIFTNSIKAERVFIFATFQQGVSIGGITSHSRSDKNRCL